MGDFYQWLGGDGAFDDQNQWEDLSTNPAQDPAQQPPTSGDDTYFGSGGTISGDGDVQSVTVDGTDVTFTGNITVSAGLTAQDGATVDLEGDTDVGSSILGFSGGSSGTIAATVNGGNVAVQGSDLQIVSGGAVSLTAGAGNFTVGVPEATSGPSTLELDNGGSITDTVAVVGGISGADATVDGGIWQSASGMAVGLFGSGTLAISDGGTVGVATGSGEFLAAGEGLGIGALEGDDGTVTVSGSGSALIAGSDTVAVGGQGAGDLEVSGGGTVSAAGTLDVGAMSGADGTLAVSDNGSTLSVGDVLIIGDGGDGTGTIGSGAAASVTNGVTVGAQDGGDGTLTITGSGSTLSVGDALTIGNAGTGSLGVLAGAAVSSFDDLIIGNTAGGSGTVSVSGADSTLDDEGALVVGNSGTGALTVTDGVLTVSGSEGATVGAESGGVGSFTLSDTSLSLNGALTVGESGNGTVKVLNSGSGGSTLDATEISVGESVGAVGTMTVDGSNSSLQSSELTIGGLGFGGIKISGTAVVSTTGDATVADQIGATGQDTVSVDTQAVWTVGGMLSVGDSANAAMKVADGAQVTAGSLQLGDGTTGVGSLAISGIVLSPGSMLASAITFGSVLEVGGAGAGTLSVGADGTVAAASDVNGGTIVIGAATGGQGTVSVSGTDAAGLVGRALQVGGAGTGILSIGTNGLVDILGGLNGGTIAVGTEAGGQDTIAVKGSAGAPAMLEGSLLVVGGAVNTDTFVPAGVVTIGTKAVVAVATAMVADTGLIELSGGGTLAGSMLSVAGIGAVGSSGGVGGAGTIAAAITNAGVIEANGGKLELTETVLGVGALDIEASSTLALDGTVGAGQTISFFGTKGVLSLGDLTDAATAPIAQFGTSDKIVLTDVAANNGTFSGGTLFLSDSGSAVGALTLVGDFETSDFKVTAGTIGSSTTITLVPCFAAGTRIETGCGERAVEAIDIGDEVRVVLDGVLAQVIWVGQRMVECARHPHPEKVWPVRVAAGAFGAGVPRRELFLSPDHAVFVEDVLIPVKCLIDGSTIVQVPRDRVTYYHIELPHHDVVLAEGLPVESFLDTGDRSDFANGGGTVRLHPDFNVLAWEALGCARLVMLGPEVDAARARIAMRKQGRRPGPNGPLHGPGPPGGTAVPAGFRAAP